MQALPAAEPAPAWLLVTEAALLWADPALCWLEVAAELSWAASTTSILPPN